MNTAPTSAPRTRVRSAPAPAPVEAIPAATPDPAKAAADGQLAWHRLRSSRGWTDASCALLMYEFIQQRGLFAEMVAFAKAR